MRNRAPLHWIEEAEARSVLTIALFEHAPPVPSRQRMWQWAAAQLERLRSSWLPAVGPGFTAPRPQLRLQPVLVSPPAAGIARRVKR